MLKIWNARVLKLVLGLGSMLTAPLWGAVPAHPGTVNYVEGQVSVDGQRLASRDVGSAELQRGQVLETEHGKAEMLLTPGVFLRLGDGSAVRMDSPGLTDTRVALLHGEAMVEVTDLLKQNSLRVMDSGATATLLKNGLYEFDADGPRVAVFDGKALVAQNDSQIELKKGKETLLNAPLRAEKFDRNVHDDLYNWSNVRSQYLAQAAAESARTYIVNAGGWYGPGWYWNPWYGMYSFIPGSGVLYSPFGWGFYSPAYIWSAPVYAYGPYGYYGGHYYGGHYGGRRGIVTTPAPRAVVPSGRMGGMHMQPSTPAPSLGAGRRR